MQTIIRFDQVSVSVQEKKILSDVSFNLNSGEKAVLCGKSGSGKSSVLKTLLGLLPINQGSVYFKDNLLTDVTIQAIRSCAAYIGQEPVMGSETVRKALLLPFQFKSHQQHLPVETDITDVLQRLDLPKTILNQSSNRISGGEKQRVALARGLLLGKSLYLLDEVTSALDTESKQAVFKVLSDPRLTVLSVSHDPEWLMRCDIVFEMDSGQITQVKKHDNAGY